VAVTAETITARGPAVVFCRTKRGADRLSDHLTRSGLASAAIHGNRNQNQRERALAAFRAGHLDVLVATDIAARGIHVDAVPLVVHFDPPADPTDYLHRSGRTGRAGADGIVVSLVGHEHLDATRLIQRRLGVENRICSPDVLSLAPVDRSRPSTSVPPRTADAAGTIKHVPVASPSSTRTATRPPRRRTRRAGQPEGSNRSAGRVAQVRRKGRARRP
jgi:superfamily II DNA/RNA helicase